LNSDAITGVSKNTNRPILYTALAMGSGMALGFLIIYFLLQSPLIRFTAGMVPDSQPFVQLLFGIFLFLGTIGLGGALMGVLGGRAISRFSSATSESHFEWRSAFSFFIAQTLMAIPTLAIVAIVSFFNQDIDVNYGKLPLVFALIGILYGLIGGLLFGLLTAGLRRTFWITLAAMAGFGAGGLLLGLVLRWTVIPSENEFLSLLASAAGFFLFGAAGGVAMALVYQGYQDQRTVFPDSTLGRVVKFVFVGGLLLLALIALSNVLDLIRIVRPDLATQLVLPTEGTGWVDAAGATGSIAAEPSDEISCENGRIAIRGANAETDVSAWAPCFADPQVATDSEAIRHAVWYTNQVTRALGGTTTGHFIMESILNNGTWSMPAIVALPDQMVEPILSGTDAGTLYLTWEGAEQSLSMTPYQCDGPPAGAISQAVYNAVRSEQFRPADDLIPHCGNRFDRMHFTPNPKAPEQTLEPTPLGAFNTVADLISNAQYEVNLVNMQWDAPSEFESPGKAIARAVADLYDKVKAHPENYPRGMTVRILLGNLPEPAVLSLADQTHHTITDLRNEGVGPSDPEIGWSIQLGNYRGNLPHAHSKFMVVDGETAVAAGFNISYLHLDENFPYYLDLGMTDMGLQMTGPVAQTVLAAYDDLWTNSDLITCWGNPPAAKLLFTLFCGTAPTEVYHPPEVLRFRVAEENDNAAFALHHTFAHLESDEALLAAIDAAQETIDLFQVNFSLSTPCLALSLVSDYCTEENFAPVYMLALRDAVINHDVHVRVMMEESAMNGIENRTGVIWFYKQLAAAGKEDNIELRFSSHKMHNKAMLVDKDFLVVGSQNFHYSAWGPNSLTEYNIATDDPAAVQQFLNEYEYWWNLAIPVEDVIGSELEALRSYQ
jgi:phosphatidylserine/phosphatidylglycerophosphate/cardiolipin synthase-like enzyme/MFS family permease